MSLPDCPRFIDPHPAFPPEPRPLPSPRAEALHDLPDLLTLTDVARILRCSKAHVCNLLNGRIRDAQRLPSVSVGRRKLIRRASLERGLKAAEEASR
jgi:hypothetical protein